MLKPRGDWDGLDAIEQRPRYDTVARLLRELNADRAVLDVGCGMALLRRVLPDSGIYIGVDVSAEALAAAGRAVVFRSRAETCPVFAIDSVVFNEVLYYCLDPVGVFRRLTTHARVVVCSVYQHSGGTRLRRRLAHLIDRRIPVNNQHCEAMVRAAMYPHWYTMADEVVGQWHIWSAVRTSRRPTPSSV
jgi:hypothetical protein